MDPTNPNPFTWEHRKYFLKCELPSLFLQQRNLCTPNRFIEDGRGMSAEDRSRSDMSAEDDSRSGMSAEDGSQGDADTQELRTGWDRFSTEWTVTAEMRAGWYRS